MGQLWVLIVSGAMIGLTFPLIVTQLLDGGLSSISTRSCIFRRQMLFIRFHIITSWALIIECLWYFSEKSRSPIIHDRVLYEDFPPSLVAANVANNQAPSHEDFAIIMEKME